MKPINQNWNNTLEFLAGMLDEEQLGEEQLTELVTETSRIYFLQKEKGLKDLDLTYRILAETGLKKIPSVILNEIPSLLSSEQFRQLSPTSQDFVRITAGKKMGALKRKKFSIAAGLIVGTLVLGISTNYSPITRRLSEDLDRTEERLLEMCSESYFKGDFPAMEQCLGKVSEWRDYDRRKFAYQRLLLMNIDKSEYENVWEKFARIEELEFKHPEIFFHEFAQAALYQRNYLQSFNLLKRAAEFRKDDPNQIMWTFHELGNVLLRQGKYAEARQNYELATQEYQQISPQVPEFLGWHHQKLAYFHFFQEDYNTARDYFNRSRKIFFDVRPDKTGQAWTLHHQLILCIQTRDSCEKLGNEVISRFEELESKEGIIWTNFQMGRYYLRDTTVSAEGLDKARKHLESSLSMEMKINSPEGIANIYSMLGKLELLSGRKEQAVKYIGKSLNGIIGSHYHQKGNFRDAVMVIHYNLRMLEKLPNHGLDVRLCQEELMEIKEKIGDRYDLFVEELKVFGLLS